ncbi:ATP synthase subunit e, mitochondrial [Salmo salar]|uniref:ATP synthase F(0) complex subunit e, mitochondrial n=1 Tax=Salmo salar TaxID=8030 RepID=A0ABM3CPC1_SALSA|nr:ATP synthase subunit e, mitochondrial-like [Salmo salar]
MRTSSILQQQYGTSNCSVACHKTARWSFLLIGMFYGKQRYDYLKPRAEEERRVEEAEKKIREEQERIAKALAEASEDTILK